MGQPPVPHWAQVRNINLMSPIENREGYDNSGEGEGNCMIEHPKKSAAVMPAYVKLWSYGVTGVGTIRCGEATNPADQIRRIKVNDHDVHTSSSCSAGQYTSGAMHQLSEGRVVSSTLGFLGYGSTFSAVKPAWNSLTIATQ